MRRRPAACSELFAWCKVPPPRAPLLFTVNLHTGKPQAIRQGRMPLLRSFCLWLCGGFCFAAAAMIEIFSLHASMTDRISIMSATVNRNGDAKKYLTTSPECAIVGEMTAEDSRCREA